MMRMLILATAAASAAAVAFSVVLPAPASAQTYGGITLSFGSNEHRWYPHDGRYYDEDDDGLTRLICSGWRADQLEGRLDHEVAEDEIDEDDADRIHGAIDRLEAQQRHECSEGDRRAIRDIAFRYDRIAQWIEREAHHSW